MIPLENGKTRRLRKSFQDVLKQFLDSDAVFDRKVPARQAPPFVVFLADLVSRDGCVWIYDVVLEVTGYVAQEDAVEDTMDAILEYLDAFSYTDDAQSWQCFIRSDGDVDSSDPNLTRRRCNLDLRLVERK